MQHSPVRASSWRGALSVVALALGASPALAEPAAPEIPPAAAAADARAGSVLEVTWPDLLRSVDEHPRLAAGALRVEAARRGVEAAGAAPNPTLEGELGQGVARDGGAARVEWGLALTMPLGWLAQRRSHRNAARAEVGVAEAERAALRRDVLVQLRSLYWHLAYAQARVASLEALAAQTQALVRTVELRVEKGESRPVEAIRVQIELQRVEGELEAARLAVPARQSELGVWLRTPPGTALVARAELDTLPPPMELEAALIKARATHPSRAVVSARADALEAELGAEKSLRAPAFSVSGFTAHELDRRAYGVGVAVDLPLWNWNSGRISQAEARLAATRMDAEAASLDLDAAVIEAEAACRTARASAARFREQLVPRSETAATTIERTYQVGEASLLEVIDARRTLLESRRAHLSALAQAQLDCNRLGALVGEEPR